MFPHICLLWRHEGYVTPGQLGHTNSASYPGLNTNAQEMVFLSRSSAKMVFQVEPFLEITIKNERKTKVKKGKLREPQQSLIKVF